MERYLWLLMPGIPILAGLIAWGIAKLISAYRDVRQDEDPHLPRPKRSGPGPLDM